MRDWNVLKERYLRDELPIRLGNLASNLARIKSRSQNAANCELVESLLQESKLFIEWTAQDAELEIAAELVELQVQLARWQYRWVGIWENAEQRIQIAEQAHVWSERVLNLSGLLAVN
jgi:SNF2 family DNA or RNA helicase